MAFRGLAFALLLAQSPALRDYRNATELFAKHDLQGAESALQEALRADPRYVPALILRSRLAMISGQMDAAQRALETAMAIDPKHSGARFLLGFCLYLENDFQAAKDALALAGQNDARVNLYLALSEEGLNHTQAAITYYERALKLDPANTETHVAYSRLVRKLGEVRHAESLIDDALKLSPAARDVLAEKGQCLFDREQYVLAAQFGERALATDGPAPGEREIRFLLARAYLKAGNRELAAKHRTIFESLPMPLVH